MPAIYYPKNRKEIYDRNVTDIQSQFDETLAFLRNHFLKALTVAQANREWEIYESIKSLQLMLFPDTALGDFARIWGSFKGFLPNPATKAEGDVTFTGIAASVIPSATIIQTADGNEYTTQEALTLEDQILNVTSITRSGQLATVTTTDEHHFGSGMSVTISGANETEYNGTFTITIAGIDKFTYTITGTPATPATGTIVADATYGSINAKSVKFGEEQNIDSDQQLTLQSPISGVDNAALVQYDGLAGGADEESDEDFRARYLYYYANTPSFFNESFIRQIVLNYKDATRAWVFPITPSVGYVTIYFVCDGRDNIIPLADDVAAVENLIADYIPVELDPARIIVAAPTAVPITFNFSTLVPNTSTMQTAIIENLKAMFHETPNVSENLLRAAYEAAIWQTVDSTNGDRIKSFSLSSPSGDITIADGELATYNTTNF